jgi:glycosyltransferase involved in cell wall biosynthesis
LRRIVGRCPEGVPQEKTTAFNALGIRYAWQRARARSRSELTRCFLATNGEFCRRVCRADWRGVEGVYTFNAAGLEVLQQAKARGLRTVCEQTIAPAAVEERLLQEERKLHPGWETPSDDRFAAEYSCREQAEWTQADLILCGSEFVREGIRQCNGPDERCRVVPYGVDAVAVPSPSNPKRQRGVREGPLRVLTIGTVSLRKGAPYVLEAARRLRGKAVFRIVGPSLLLETAERQLRNSLEWAGAVPRHEVAGHFAWADVFLLPSICEGSATVTYEALAHGLPVVCTPNTGSVVREGIEGYVVPVRDTAAIVERLRQLHGDRELLARLGAQAGQRAAEFTLDCYAERLLQALSAIREAS